MFGNGLKPKTPDTDVAQHVKQHSAVHSAVQALKVTNVMTMQSVVTFNAMFDAKCRLYDVFIADN